MAARILIIDDERSLSQSLVKALQGAHYSAISAFSGQEGMDHLQTGSFDLVIQNLQLPDVDGLDLLSQIQAAFPKVQVLIFIKPIQPDEIIKLIPRLLSPQFREEKPDPILAMSHRSG